VAFTIFVGSISFSGSVITFAKLQEMMTTRPVLFKGQQYVMGILTIAALGGSVLVVLQGSFLLGTALMVVGLVMGVLLVLPVGGADVPIVISLLGASGTILTRAMASAMGRSVNNIIFGAFKGGSTAGSTEISDRPVKSGSAEDVAILLGYAQRVIVVPGYGLAVAQAQHTMHELAKALEGKGIEVVFGIHPVAGRMPGHMNVLLAEANVPYEVLQEMDEVNPQFKTADVCLVVGANDVVNPAAKTTPGSPIYGMPILDAGEAKQVVFLKRSMRPGFAGIENELLYEPNTTLLFGDAKETLGKVLSAVKAL
jgi:NAD(P) transhydrogenase subunit beta